MWPHTVTLPRSHTPYSNANPLLAALQHPSASKAMDAVLAVASSFKRPTPPCDVVIAAGPWHSLHTTAVVATLPPLSRLARHHRRRSYSPPPLSWLEHGHALATRVRCAPSVRCRLRHTPPHLRGCYCARCGCHRCGTAPGLQPGGQSPHQRPRGSRQCSGRDLQPQLCGSVCSPRSL